MFSFTQIRVIYFLCAATDDGKSSITQSSSFMNQLNLKAIIINNTQNIQKVTV